jgi:hypothetical protein
MKKKIANKTKSSNRYVHKCQDFKKNFNVKKK